MFDKHKGNKQGASAGTEAQKPRDEFTMGGAQPAKSSGQAAIIGPGIHIIGEVAGEQNIIIEGKVEGKINLGANEVNVGDAGQVNADVSARVVKVSGTVVGDINGQEKVVISQSGNVRGNIIAPRVTLEDGALFRGSIDMDPGDRTATELPLASRKAAAPAAEEDKKEPSLALKGH